MPGFSFSTPAWVDEINETGLILTGGVLYGCGLLMRRIAVWKA